MTLTQIENSRSQSQDQIPIEDPQQARTGLIPTGADPVGLLNWQPVSDPFICNYPGCNIPFSTSSYLQQHIWQHSGDMQRKCKCGRKVTGMDPASRSHINECGQLDKERTPTFNTKCNDIYGCRRDGCVENFGQFHDLLMHLKVVHPKKRPCIGLNYRDSRPVDSHQVQQVVGNIVQRLSLVEDDTSTAEFFCYHPKCQGKAKLFGRWRSLQEHVWTHSARRQRECTCDDGGPRLREKFDSHLEQDKCQRRDPNRIPSDLEGMMIYGCIKNGAAFVFNCIGALQKHLNSPWIPCPRCGVSFTRINAHRCPINADNENPDSGQVLLEAESESQALVMEVREGSTTSVSKGAPESLPIAIQPQQPVGLDADPAEYGDYDNNPAPILQPQQATESGSGLSFLLNLESSQARSPRQSLAPSPGGSIASRETHSQPPHREAQDEMRESISQGEAMPARHIQNVDPAEDYEDGNPTNDNKDEDKDNDDDDDYDYEDSFEDDYRSLPRVSRATALRKAAVRGAHRRTGILRTNSPAHPVTEVQSPPAPSPSKDSSLTDISNGPAPIRRKRGQPRSEAGEDERAAKKQRTRHEQHATKSAATEIVQDQGQSQRICLDSPAIATPPPEPSSVHSPPSRSLDDRLDANSAKDGDGDRILSGAFISSETAMVAPGPRGSDVGAHNDGDDVGGARRRSDHPSQREEQRRQQQQDTFKRQDIAIEFTAKISSVLGRIDESVKGAEVRQREAEEKEENIKSRIEEVERWQYDLEGLMAESNEDMRKLKEELNDCQKEKQSAAREAKHESQRKRDMAREIEDVLRRHGCK